MRKLLAALVLAAASLIAGQSLPLVMAQSVGGGFGLGMAVGQVGIPALSAANLTSGSSITAATSFVTASVSPGTNKLVIVSVGTLCAAACGSLTPTVTGASGTWVNIGVEHSADGLRITAMFRDLSATPGSGALTIAFGSTSQTNAVWSVDQFSNTVTTGTHGSDAIAQFVGAADTATDTSFSCTLAALGATANAAYAEIRVGAAVALTDNLTHLSTQSNTGITGDAQWGINATAATWTYASTGGQNARSGGNQEWCLSVRKSDDSYPFTFDLVTGEHGFKKTHRVTLSEAECKALKAIEDRLKRKTGASSCKISLTKASMK